jgi:hypothetical protein
MKLPMNEAKPAAGEALARRDYNYLLLCGAGLGGLLYGIDIGIIVSVWSYPLDLFLPKGT